MEVCFESNGDRESSSDRLQVQWISKALPSRNHVCLDIVAVAFYRLAPDQDFHYVMSLWHRNAESGEIALLNHDLLYWKPDADWDTEKLCLSVDESRVDRALRFPKTHVEASFNWAALLGLRVVQNDEFCILAPRSSPLPLDQSQVELCEDNPR